MTSIINRIKHFFQPIVRFILSPFTKILNYILKFKGMENIRAALDTPEIRKRIYFTCLMVVIFRILAAIPLPGIDTEVFLSAVNTTSGSPFSSLLTVVTGGRIDTPSLVVIGLGSYINASIVIQLLTSVVPKLEELSKEGPNGRKILSQVTRILTVPLSALQGFVVYTILKQSTDLIPDTNFAVSDMVTNLASYDVLLIIIAIIAGSILLMWLGELITENGIGNGSSIIIMIGILSTLPGLFVQDFSQIFTWVGEQLTQGNASALFSGSMIFVYLLVIGVILLVAGIVYINEATRKLTIQYASRVRGTGSSHSNFLPLKLNQAGVMPIIFASSILTFPTLIGQFILSAAEPGTSIHEMIQGILSSPVFDYRSMQYMALYFFLILAFTIFYSFIILKPEETAENLKKSGGFIPGIRPGSATTKFITRIMLRLTIVGAIFLAVIAILPNIVRLTEQGQNMIILTGIGGTSILIIVGVVLDTMRQMKSLTVSKSYEMYK